MASSWRTMFPEYQEEVSNTPRKRIINDKMHKSQISPLMTPNVAEAKINPRKFNRNTLSKDNPLSNSMFIPSAPKMTKVTNKNNISIENPLNYKAQNIKSARIINTKITASKISGLPGSITVASPPRIVKTKNSESYIDFLPGSYFPKQVPDDTSRKKFFVSPNETSDAYKTVISNKKLKKNKLDNEFSINTQF